MVDVSIIAESWKLAQPFEIARQVITELPAVVCEIKDGEHSGRGESIPVTYAGETSESVINQLNAVKHKIRSGMKPSEAQILLPHGAARNALDCALWDLDSKRTDKPAWQLAGLSEFNPLTVTYTLGIDTPMAMMKAAQENKDLPILKVKLKGDGQDMERMHAVREGTSTARLIVDANEGWGKNQLADYIPQLAKLNVELIEQPVPAGSDYILEDFESEVPLCADESCNDAAALPYLMGKYQFINIKLDKSGGLTEALHLAREALKLNFRLMVGCMCGTSLGMAPASIIGQLCEIVDLDGPLLFANDRDIAVKYDRGTMTVPREGLWG